MGDWVKSELVFTSFAGDWSCCKRFLFYSFLSCKVNELTIILPGSTFDSPVVVAVVVNSAFTIEKKTIFTGFQSQASICTKEELVAVLGVSISLDTFWLRTCWC